MEQQTLEFWRNMALGLKDELVQRGERIAELEAQLARQGMPSEVREAIRIAERVLLYASDGLTCIEYDKLDMGKAAYVLHNWLDQQPPMPWGPTSPKELARLRQAQAEGKRMADAALRDHADRLKRFVARYRAAQPPVAGMPQPDSPQGAQED